LSWYDPDREISIEAWTSFLNQAVKFRPWINISGGEPMLYSQFGELIRAARKRALPVEINTNGTLLARQAELIVRNGVSAVSISIDGPEDVHDVIRGKRGLFRRSMEGIKALVEARRDLNSPTPIIQIACTISKANLASLEEMVPLAAGLSADILLYQHTDFNTSLSIERHNRILSADKASNWGLDILQPSIPEGEYYQSEIGPEDVALLKRVLGKVKRQANGQVKVYVSPDIKPNKIKSYYLDVDYPSSQECIGLWTTLRVLPDGTVSPCLHVRAGNITEQPIREIWNGSVMQNLRRLVSLRLFPGCARCCHRRF
jgi:MoaA/NifB/PqqE/SkfB family radical SAM enzyme